MKVLIHGISGRMGGELSALCLAGVRGAELVCGVDARGEGDVYKSFAEVPAGTEIDCIIDFSFHTAVKGVLDYAVAHGIPTVIATTGLDSEERAYMKAASEKIPLFHSANMSVGVALLVELAKTAAKAMPGADIEIIERHHNRKADAPSGTALMIAEGIRSVRPELENKLGRSGMCRRSENEIGIHAIRVGNVVGEHEVIVGTDTQTITLKHEAHSRALFAEGAIAAAAYIEKKAPGFYEMKDLISD